MNQIQPPKNPARRRLAKGAAAVPAVLASISTKNALATPIYGCTVSGQMSGNASPGRDLDPDCGGKTVSSWKSFYDGKATANVPDWFGVTRKSGYAYSEPRRYDVFNKTSGTKGLKFKYDPQLTAVGFAVYCNAESGGYHVSTTECEALFRVAVGADGETRYVKNGHEWLQADCIEYFTMLTS